jgi:ribosomal protein S18 acetylase RimI-like enzyme
MLVVATGARGRGVGSALLAAAEERVRARGCVLFEITSNMRRKEAHGFYQKRGFERTGYRFAKALA